MKNTIYVERENLPDGATHLQIDVFYDKGGRRYPDTWERGYYIGVLPMNLDTTPGWAVCNPFGGIANLIKATDKYRPSEYAAVVRYVKEHLDELIDDLLA